MTQLYAQPYNIDATGFFFTSKDEFQERSSTNRDRFGQRVEEYEIQFIDGETIDAELARAFELSQCNFVKFLESAENWSDDQKTRFVIAVAECGYDASIDPDEVEIDIYELDSLTELAEQFIEEGLFGDIPERLRFYLDLDAIARDLAMDYTAATIAGRRIIYRCG